ncbi:MAG: hypothetical protein ACYDCN_05935 [Bacteroidia bacterium]
MTKTKKKGLRISTSPKKFDPYITSTDDRLQAVEPTSGEHYWQYLGLSSTNGSDWHNKRTYWDTPLTGLHALYTNPDTSTSTVKGRVKQFIKDFRAFADPLLSLIAANPNSTATEEQIFNLVLNKNRKKPTHTHTKIADQCFTDWTGHGGGNMKAGSKSEHDSKRHSLAEGADGVQYATMIMDDTPENIATAIAAVVAQNLAAANARIANPSLPAPIPIPLPTAPPAHPDDGAKQEFFSGATQQFSFGADKKGKYLYVWSRWFNSKHPEIAGDWNARQVVLIN